MLRIHRLQSPVTVLGPGSRAVVWVQGCDIGCRGCLAPYMQDTSGGTAMSLAEVSQWVIDQPNIEGITITGGEPTMQSGELVAVSDTIRKHRDLGVPAYTGRTIEALIEARDASVSALLDRVDLLVDGPYIRIQHADLLWRGSRNQRLIPLTDRYRKMVESLTPASDRSAGIEFTASCGILYYVGVPAEPDFDKKIERELTLRDFTEQ